MQINEFLSRLSDVTQTSNGWKACCPAHDDHSPSLSISEGADGRILLHCHAGCSAEETAAAVGLQMSDLFQGATKSISLNIPLLTGKAMGTARYRSKKGMCQTAFHPYERDGVLVAGVFRFDPADGSDGKEYVPVHATATGGAVGDPSGGWPLYNSTKLSQSPDEPVLVVEGEKAADALTALGFLATTSAHGSKAWRKTDWSPLIGRSLLFLPDNDDPGRCYVNEVAAHLMEQGADPSFRYIDLSSLPEKADAVELIEQLRSDGLDDQQMSEAILAMAADWIPDAEQISAEEQLMQELEAEYGAPFTLTAKRKASGISQQFAAGYCANVLDVLFDPAVERFYEYEPQTGLWVVQTDAYMTRRVDALLGKLLAHFGTEYLRPKCTRTILVAIVNLMKGVVECRDQWAANKKLLHVANGMLLLDESDQLMLLPFDKDYFSRNRSDYPWEPEAQCPRFLQDLLKPALSDEGVLLLQKYAGQCLLGNNPSQTLLLIRGTAGGGKSSLCEIIESAIGEQNVAQLRVEQLGTRFEVRRFLARTLLSGKDVPGDFLDSKGAHVIKSLVGGDRLEGEVKGGNESFEVRGEFNVIITSNSRLHVKLDGDAGAWRRRLLIVDFVQPPVNKPIPFFAQQLLEKEGAGILRWMVEGAVLLLQDLEECGIIKLSEAQKRKVEDLLSESDSIRSFVNECVISTDPDDSITTAELLAAYFDYCEDRGWQAQPKRKFETCVADVMMDIHRAHRRNDIQRGGKGQRGYSTVALRGAEPAATPPDPVHPEIRSVEIYS